MLRCVESPTRTRSRFDVVHLHSGSSLRFFAHDRILHRPALRVAGQFLAGRFCWGRLSLRPPLTRVIRRLLSSARRTGPAHPSVRHRLAALLCGSAAALMGFWSFAVFFRRDSWRKLPRQPTCRLLDFAAPGPFSTQGPAGVFSIFLCADQSRLVDCGSWVFRLASRAVPTRRDRPLLPWTFPLPGFSGVIRVLAESRAGAGLDTCRQPPVPGRLRASTPAWLHGPSAHELGPFARSSACWRNRRLF